MLDGIVEIDETYIGRKEGIAMGGGGVRHKMKVLSLVQRGGGSRSVVIEQTNSANIIPVVKANVAAEASVMTDEHSIYRNAKLGEHFASHGVVCHQFGEYARGSVHTNTIEGFFSIFKRGMRGVYQHCREKHLHRYLAEFDFRYSNRIALGCDDLQRADRMLRSVVGKRLKYA
jgi:transposase-like protein